ncbi:cellulose binding domain-containing protein, partial [Actinosynnema sp. NPDC059797]
ASDVYSLGATLYAALEGHPPFGATDNPYALLRRVSEGRVEPLRSPGPLGDVLLRVLRRDPGERPTMAEVHELLGAVVEGRPLPGAPAFDGVPGFDENGSNGDGELTGVTTPVNGTRFFGETELVDQARPDDRTRPVVDDRSPAGTRPLLAPRRARWRKVVPAAGAAVLVAVGVVLGGFLRDGESEETALPAPTATTTGATTGATTAATTGETAAGTTGGTAATTPAPSSGCTARFRVTTSWPGGYQAEVTVRNDGGRALTGWTVTWLLPPGHVISNLWDGNLAAEGGSVRVGNADYNAELPVDGSTTFGFTANGPEAPRPDVACASGD